MEAIALYPGSCGEIIQGMVEDTPMLISCPINLFTKVRLFETKEPELKRDLYKTRRFMENLLDRWGFGDEAKNIGIEIESSIPRGKGYASSTADLCGAYYAAASMFKKKTNTEELLAECVKIEPTDSILFKDLTLLDYKRGEKFRKLGKYREFYLLVYEGERLIDTLEFNRSNIPQLADIDDLVPLMENGNIRSMAEAATESFLRNQKRLKYEAFQEALKIMKKYSGLGIMGGHSGDVMAVIFEDMEQLSFALKSSCSIKGYKSYPLKTLRSVIYEDNNDCSTIQWKW